MAFFRICVAFVAFSLVIDSILVLGSPAQSSGSGSRFKRSAHRKKRAVQDIRNCETSPTYIPDSAIRTDERLRDLRDKMRNNKWNLDAYIVSNTDPHLSEFPPLRDRRQEFMSGFRGSYAQVIITLDKSLLWTDARYWQQAEQQLDCNWELMKEGTIDEELDPNDPERPDILVLSPVDWMIENLDVESRIGFDPRLMPLETYQHFKETFDNLDYKRLHLVPIEEFEWRPNNDQEPEMYDNLIDLIWEKEGSRPIYAREPLEIVDADTYTGESWEDKIFRYRDERSLRWLMKEKEVQALVIPKLDEVAWLFNLRGEDIPNNPFFLAYSIITENEIRLYLYDIDWKITNQIEDHLKMGDEYACPKNGLKGPNCISIQNYENFYEDLKNLPVSNKIWVTNDSSILIHDNVPSNKRIIEQSPILRMRAVKSAKEIEGMRNAHIRDSVSFIRTASWIEETVEYQREENKRLENDDPQYRIYISELDVVQRLEEYRQYEISYIMPAFSPVSAFGRHSSMVTYNVTEDSDVRIDETNLYLLETGAHYVDGTTDIARTFWFEYKKTPPQNLRDQYTRALMGLIDLSSTVFRTGIYGRELDAIARRKLWMNGLDYLHATGHGIGHYGSIHEGPIGIGVGYERSEIPLERGMFLTNEPGYYEENHQYGIRLENVMVIVQAKTNYTFGDYDWNTFDTVSLVPFEKNLIDHTMLNPDQIRWLNAYNTNIRKVIGPFLGSSSTTPRKWLDRRTQKIKWNYHVSGAETTISLATTTAILIMCSVMMSLFL